MEVDVPVQPKTLDDGVTVWTIGHSTRELQEFVELLGKHGIERLVDVRRFPTSRRLPHFKREALAEALGTRGIAYHHAPAMGGYRGKPRQGSPNDAWRAAGFQAYADHAGTQEFQDSLERLIARARRQRTAIMCAEITPWRCHRQIIADHLVARGIEVVHIVDERRSEEHALNEHARVDDDGRVLYPAEPDDHPTLFDEPRGTGREPTQG